MNFTYNNILHIPNRALLNQKITKAFFFRNFLLSASEKKLLNKTIQKMQWLASIKTATSNIPTLKTATHIYQEIQIILCKLSNNELEKSATKCIDFIQKHIPYQVLLIVEDDNEFVINVCDKRVNQNDNTKRTIENHTTTQQLYKLYKNETTALFYHSLNFKNLDKTNLETTYKSYHKAIIQLQTATITGKYVERPKKRTETDMIYLKAIEHLEEEISSLANQIKKENQFNTKTDFNIKIQRKRKEIKVLKNKLTQP